MKRFNKILVFFILLVIIAVSITPSYSAESPKEFYRRISRNFSKNKNDYLNFLDNFSDEEFANFREINTTGISKGKLYRSSSPINDWGNRNLIADKLSEIAGIKTFINLVDSNEKMQNYKGFSQTYYSKQNSIALNMNLKFLSNDFKNKLAKGVKFMARNEPPFLIHCNLGKDRSGLFCAVIEAFMGATPDEIVDDFLKSFHNYFGIMPGSNDYYFVANNEIKPFLASILGVKNIENVNLANSAENYLLKIGVTQNEIVNLRSKLK